MYADGLGSDSATIITTMIIIIVIIILMFQVLNRGNRNKKKYLVINTHFDKMLYVVRKSNALEFDVDM